MPSEDYQIFFATKQKMVQPKIFFVTKKVVRDHFFSRQQLFFSRAKSNFWSRKKRIGRETWVDIWSYLSYKGAHLKVVESFKYLGALLHWKQDASSAWSDRENTGFKAFGTLLCSLVLLPFLPLRRVIEVTNAIVGGAYLYAGELWAPFIPRRGATPGSRISRQVRRGSKDAGVGLNCVSSM